MAIFALPTDRSELPRRLPQLLAGLLLYGASMAVLYRAGLGQAPWSVLNQGVADLLHLDLGATVLAVGLLVLLLWIPLRQRPGIGTIGNVLLLGVAMDGTLALLPTPAGLPARAGLLVAGLLLNGMATGLYIGAGLGAGPRDGLMTGLHRRTGRSLRLLRTGIELTVLATGILLGGTAGLGTVAYALTVGPLAQFFLRVFTPAPARTRNE
ncbi:YczE/YyaS/YitT family protein [Kitasatospora viridis]|uniref:Putative membrane protein YczE n=1 Tax=Kitasatospora viridis TaxID=281105 RepID=A0A561UCT8_9ACTN|nr:hypothetical protein [Kitasatospora viridis]TWF97194.1 putative membrane protein YczE [Kitasatospora viridis]